MAFYEVVLKGDFAGQAIVNKLWYRDVIPAIELGEFLGLLDAINATVRDEIWRSQAPAHIRGQGLQEQLPSAYTLQQIETKAYNADFTIVNDTPVTLTVEENGLLSGGIAGADRCFIMKANLEPSFGPGIGLPKRGYLAVGPAIEANIDDSGRVAVGALPGLVALGANLATNITTTLPPTVLFPIRVRLTRVLHVITNIAYKDVSNFVPNPVASYRKSRAPEA